jgi:hypothetical protein
MSNYLLIHAGWIGILEKGWIDQSISFKGAVMTDTSVLIRIYDTQNRHLKDVELQKAAALYLAPGRYLSDYDWAETCGIQHSTARQIRSVGEAHEGLVVAEAQPPWMSIWVDAF